MAAESSEGEEEAKLTGGNQLLVVDDDLREMGKKAAWSVSSCKPGNGVSSLRDDNLETYWQWVSLFHTNVVISLHLIPVTVTVLLAVFGFRSDGAQPHLVNIQFQKKVRLQVCTSIP